VIQQKVEDPLSDKLLAGEFVNGDSISVDVNQDGEIELRRENQKEEAPVV
jgi:ATP-dependent Clp protease ATP-binding subunit ClpA